MRDCKCDAKQHALEVHPKEACGVIAGGKYWRCRNIANKPEDCFAIEPKDYVAARAFGGKIEAIVHSHPKGDAPSEPDKKACTRTNVPWYIYLVPEDKWLTITP